eukprot:TRINITY_DN1890_c0_g1_i1.p3 TRINITY_DN1890_c0_g1~~TRINITY_DN1890_c0_g1_i1.p3  ORF type:complete len:113 (-),score=2.17 TRINITY_DN1890_c0_g1_i1:545-883(-)
MKHNQASHSEQLEARQQKVSDVVEVECTALGSDHIQGSVSRMCGGARNGRGPPRSWSTNTTLTIHTLFPPADSRQKKKVKKKGGTQNNITRRCGGISCTAGVQCVRWGFPCG